MLRRPRPQLVVLLAVVAVLGSAVLVMARSPSRPAVATTGKTKYLQPAEQAVARSHRWWDSKRGWYLEQLGGGPFATLWGVVHLFEATDAVAIADPTPAHIAAVRAFARGADRYWNGNLQPVPGYSSSRGTRDPHHRTWYDDNGWWGMAYYDAYRATGDRSYLVPMQRALTFLDSGWDPQKGGIWWNTDRTFKAGESLAGATWLAARLYAITRDPTYLAMANKYINWADTDFKGEDGLYDRNEVDPTPMPYVEGPMAVAFVVLCQSTGNQAYCAEGEELADRAAKRFPTLTMGPQYDAMYVLALLELYGLDHNPRWYRIAKAATDRAMVNARTAGGYYMHAWDGRPMSTVHTPRGKLQTHAATASVIAWMAATPPPA
jgi:rhamnogalacturonyl hydrolase YesR